MSNVHILGNHFGGAGQGHDYLDYKGESRIGQSNMCILPYLKEFFTPFSVNNDYFSGDVHYVHGMVAIINYLLQQFLLMITKYGSLSNTESRI